METPPDATQSNNKSLRFQCQQCGKCCNDPATLVNITYADIDRFQRVMGLTLDQLIKILGFYIYESAPTEEQVKKMVVPPIQTEQGPAFIALKKDKNGKCVFLDENNKCQIYDARPNICRTFPFHFHSVPQTGKEPRLDISINYAQKALDYCPGIGKDNPIIDKKVWLGSGSETIQNLLTEHVLVDKYNQAVKNNQIEPSAKSYILTVLELNRQVHAPSKKKKVSYQARVQEKLQK